MEPEKLRVLAEGMGWMPVCIHHPDGYLNENGRNQWPNPLTNDVRCMEIMEKLKIGSVYGDSKWSAFIYKDGKIGLDFTSLGSGKTINEAVCNAAFDYFNSIKEDKG